MRSYDWSTNLHPGHWVARENLATSHTIISHSHNAVGQSKTNAFYSQLKMWVWQTKKLPFSFQQPTSAYFSVTLIKQWSDSESLASSPVQVSAFLQALQSPLYVCLEQCGVCLLWDENTVYANFMPTVVNVDNLFFNSIYQVWNNLACSDCKTRELQYVD